MKRADEAPPLVHADASAVRRAGELILAGAVVAYPTETLYGLAVDASAAAAVERLLWVKRRDPTHSVSLLVADEQMLGAVVSAISPLARRLMQQHWPGPLTLVLAARDDLPAALVGASGGVGVRVSSDPVATALVRAVGRPITATSANLSHEEPATTAAQAALPGVALVLDDGQRAAQASTVVELVGQPRVLRGGPLRVDLEQQR